MPTRNSLLVVAIALVAALVSGCNRQREATNVPELDEQAQLVKKAGLPVNHESLTKYAYEHFYPRELPQDRQAYPGQHDIQNYFEGMDCIAGPVSTDKETKAYQLIDKQAIDTPALIDPLAAPQKGDVEMAKLHDSEVLGRNSWVMWCGGNERFWDWLATDLFGFIDLLKLVDSQGRGTRFNDAGMINEPEMMQSTAPLEDEFGLRLDLPASEEVRTWRANYVKEAFGDALSRWQAADDRRNSKGMKLRYPERDYKSEGKVGSQNYGANSGYGSPTNAEAYERKVPPPTIYGLSSGVVGLRLFPNPKFLESKEAQEHWDPKRYYTDPSYYNDPKLIRPYRVGIACAYCHVSFHPLNPPRDVANPKWENISGSIGAQYLRIRAAFGNMLKPDNFTYHALDSQPPGTIDTSLIPSDNVNNTNTMNAIWNVPMRVVRSFELPPEKVWRSSAAQPSLWGNLDGKAPAANYGYGADTTWGNDTVPKAWSDKFAAFQLSDKIAASNGNPRWVPRILFDGADSVGAWVALARVYLNIGTYSEQWNKLHNPVVGFKKQRPFKIKDCEENSVYWNATQLRVGPMRDYFLRITPPMPLLAAKDDHVRIEVETKGQLAPLPVAIVPVDRLAPAVSPPQPGQSYQPRIQPIDEAALRARLDKEQSADFKALLAKEKAKHIDTSKLAVGRQVFARNCIVCHSSVQPESHLADFPPNLKPEEKTKREQARAELIVGKDGAAKYVGDYGKLAQRRRGQFDEWANNGEFWDHDPGQWLGDDNYKKWAAEVVEHPEFWAYNYLSTDYRIPVNYVGTNSARAMATNGMTGNLWEDFSSESFRELPSVGPITFPNPYPWKDGGKQRARLLKDKPSAIFQRADGTFAFTPQHKVAEGVPHEGGGGPGFYRVPSLISVWATAPLLHNNSLGLFNNDPSVDGRLAAFDDAIRKLLWPEKRLESSSYNGATAARLKADNGLIWRLPHAAALNVPAKYAVALGNRMPLAMWFHATLSTWIPWLESPWVKAWPWVPSAVLLVFAYLALLVASKKLLRWLGYLAVFFAIFFGLILYLGSGKLGDVNVGPFPKGTPVNLVLNINPDANEETVRKTINFVLGKLGEIESKHLDDEAAQKVMAEQIAPALMEISKCPDFVMDRGHYFPWFKSMTEDEKNALIELLKTF